MIQFKNPKFIKTAIHPKDYPTLKADSGEFLPEVAVIGRSNVGKSTLLNHLFQRKGLVKTSSKPGKTRAVNFFSLNDEAVFVDLPGYGYAEVSVSVKKTWGKMIQDYFEKREPLDLLLFLFDIRRTPNDDDKELMAWLVSHEIPVVLILTKVDKVKQSEKVKNTRRTLETFDVEGLPYLHYSATKNVGRKELMHTIRQQFKGED